MSTYQFKVVTNATVLTEADCDRLYEMGCDDGTVVTRNSITFVAFDREASSLEDAIRSATANVRAAGLDVARVEIEADVIV